VGGLTAPHRRLILMESIAVVVATYEQTCAALKERGFYVDAKLEVDGNKVKIKIDADNLPR
jgi:hypothetical protein